MKIMSGVKKRLVLLLACLLGGTAAGAYIYDANDFATEVIEYIEGDAAEYDWINGLAFDNPANALGRPTVDTTGDNWNVVPPFIPAPVVNVYPAFRSFELVTIGEDGKLVLKFGHRVRDDENNPYGLDFIVFGNSQQKTGTVFYWENKDPTTFMVKSSELITDDAIVSVSQDGVTWYSYTSGPYADNFAPTFGRVYDPCNPDTSIGSWNLWWGHVTNPVLPLDPTITAGSLTNKSVADISLIYGESAGGTGFDIKSLSPADYAALAVDPNTGEKWIQYVKIVGKEDNTPEVDAVSDVSCCGDWKHSYPEGDITYDCLVDYEDLAELADSWLHEITGPDDPAAIADIYWDNVINFKDWAIMAENWFDCTWQCE